MNKGALSVVLAGGLLAGFALQAETRVWKGPSGGSWSEPTNWEGGVPENGDSVAFENADAIEVDNNIDDLTLGAILLRGAGQVTVGGKALSFRAMRRTAALRTADGALLSPTVRRLSSTCR